MSEQLFGNGHCYLDISTFMVIWQPSWIFVIKIETKWYYNFRNVSSDLANILIIIILCLQLITCTFARYQILKTSHPQSICNVM